MIVLRRPSHALALAPLAFALLLGGCSQYGLERLQDPPEPPPEGDDDDATEPPPDEEFFPNILVQPEELFFGDVTEFCSATDTFWIENIGEADLEVTEVSVVNMMGGMWDLAFVDPMILAPGERSDDLPLVFHASGDLGVQSGELRVLSNDPDEPEALLDTGANVLEVAGGHERFNQGGADAVDVLWVVDNSGSMSDFLSRVATNFDSFLSAFVELDLDFRMAAVTTDMDDPLHQGRMQGEVPFISSTDPVEIAAFTDTVRFGDGGSGSERGSDAVHAALNEPLISTENGGFLREEAILSIIVISDEDDDSDMNAPSFISWVEGLKGPGNEGRVNVNAIAGPVPLGCSTIWSGFGFDPVSATAAYDYDQIARETGGLFESICEEDYASSLTSIGGHAAGLYETFYLSGTPGDLSSIRVEIDGVPATRATSNGWLYDLFNNCIRFDGTAVPPQESVIDVYYDGGTPCID